MVLYLPVLVNGLYLLTHKVLHNINDCVQDTIDDGLLASGLCVGLSSVEPPLWQQSLTEHIYTDNGSIDVCVDHGPIAHSKNRVEEKGFQGL